VSALFDAYSKKDDLPGLANLYPGRVNVFDERTPYNHLDPMGDSPQAHALTTARLLLHGEDILPGTADFLADAIIFLYRQNGVLDGSEKYPTWAEVYDYVSSIKPFDNMTKYYRTVLRAKIRALIDAFGPALTYRKGLDLRHTAHMNNVFVQGSAMLPSTRRFHLLDHLTRRFTDRRRSSFDEISQMQLRICVIDDAAEVFDIGLERRGDPPPIFELLTMARQYRIAFVFASQIPELLGRAAWNNHGTTICFRLPNRESRMKVGEVFGTAASNEDRRFREERLDALRALEPCSGVIQHLRASSPLPFSVTPVNVPVMSQGDKCLYMQPFWRAHPPAPYSPDALAEKPVLSDDAKRLLMLAASKPGQYSTKYYEELGWALSTGTRIRNKLEDAGYIKIYRIATGRRGGCPEIIELLPLAYATLGIEKSAGNGHGSFVHNWWALKIQQWLEKHHNGDGNHS